jgi:hypothetical protein
MSLHCVLDREHLDLGDTISLLCSRVILEILGCSLSLKPGDDSAGAADADFVVEIQPGRKLNETTLSI